MILDSALLEAFRGLSASTVYEANGKAGDVALALRPIGLASTLVGRACTVRCWPGDLGAVRRAVDGVGPGDVLVIDSGCGDQGTTWGGGATIAAIRLGLAGVVTNGTTRDVAQVQELGLPVFCAGSAVRGGTRAHAGWVGVPVALGGVVVAPGDLVLADMDGIVVVARQEARAVLQRATERHRQEQAREERLRAGEAYNFE